jgi:hypothetical protein
MNRRQMNITQNRSLWNLFMHRWMTLPYAPHARLFSGLLLFLTLAGCSTLEIRIEKTPTPNQSAVATLAALMIEGTRNAALITQIALQPTASPAPGIASGRVCYPSEHIPAMVAFFKDISTENLDELQIMSNQTSYQVELLPGQYVAYAWAASYQVAGMYSKAVPCGLTASCNDHSPQVFTVQPGQATTGIDLCDWVIPVEQLPIPPGSELPTP